MKEMEDEYENGDGAYRCKGWQWWLSFLPLWPEMWLPCIGITCRSDDHDEDDDDDDDDDDHDGHVALRLGE